MRTFVVAIFFRLQNIRVMAEYYTRLEMKRMAELLDLSESVSFSQFKTEMTITRFWQACRHYHFAAFEKGAK